MMNPETLLKRLRTQGYDLLEDKSFAGWKAKTGGMGVIHCRKKRGRRFELIVMLHKGKKDYYLSFPHGINCLVKNESRLEHIFSQLFHEGIPGDPQLPLDQRVRDAFDLEVLSSTW